MQEKMLSIVMPCYNEEDVINHTVDTLIQKMAEYQIQNYEIVIVDDGSKDKSLSILQEYAKQNSLIKIVSLAANKGQQNAFYTGLCYSSGDAVVLMDIDLQDPPECIPQMLKLWQEGYQVVYGKRAKRDGESFLKRLTAYLFYRTLNKFSYTDIPNDVGEFRLMDRVIVDIIINMKENNRFNRAMVSWLGFKQIELEFDRPERFAGETKFGWKDMLKLAKDALFSFSYFPIQMIQGLGVFSVFISIILLIYALTSQIMGWTSPGWTSLMVVIVFFSGAILFALGLIGEYIARIHTEVLQRPLFIAAKTYNLKDKSLPAHMEPFMSKNNQDLQ